MNNNAEIYQHNSSQRASTLEETLQWIAGEEASLPGRVWRYWSGVGVLTKSVTTMAGLDYEGQSLGWRRYPLGALMIGEGLSRLAINGLELLSVASGVIGYVLGADTRFLLDVATDIGVLEGVKAGITLGRRALVGAVLGGWRGAVRYATEPLREHLPYPSRREPSQRGV